MEAKNVALLGFVTAAQEYVEKHMNDGSNLGDLENVDIKRLKEELSAQLKFFAMPEEEKNNLISSGEKAFDEYVEENLKPKANVIDELGQIFNVSFDDYDVKPIKETVVIDDLLETYNAQENEEIAPVSDDENVEILEITNDENKKEESSNKVDGTDEFGLTADDDILLTIANAAAKSDEELAKEFNQKTSEEPKTLDVAFADVMKNEQAKVENPNAPLSEILKNIGGNENSGYYENTELPKENRDVKPVIKSVGTLSSELKNISNNVVQQPTIIQKEMTAQPTNILVNPGLDAVLENERKENFYNVSTEEERATISENIVVEEDKDHTLSEALAGLGKLQKKQETTTTIINPIPEVKETPKVEPQPEKETYVSKPIIKNNYDDKIYSNIMVAYPYLNRNFIIFAYGQKDEIDSSYIIGEDYIILHRLVFTDIEELHEFVEIMMAHNYLVNVDEKKMIVDVIKEFVNREGVILTNIFSIANQAKILNGEYEGYRLFEKEGK